MGMPQKSGKYLINTFGCQMSFHDAEIIEGLLRKMGYEGARGLEDADIVLFNTCCVREKPERKVLARLEEMKRLKEEKPHLIVAVSGCMVQQEAQLENIRENYPQVDLIFGTHNIYRLPELLERVVTTGQQVIEVWERGCEGEIVEGLPARRQDDLKAWVNITYGCDNFCSYCIVPYVRGRERSRHMESVIQEVRELGLAGYKEVTLLGQNVNSYGKDLEGDVNFAKLLEALNEVPGVERIRYTTSHPRDFTPHLISTLARLDKVCEHIHLPLQAGSDRVLAMMNRGYTAGYYMDLVSQIREEIPGCSITTDLMIGFPGERDDDFQKTLDMVEKIRFDAAYTFVYSPRTGTRAAKMPDQVPEELKRERIMKLVEVQNQITGEVNETMEDRVYEILVEGTSKNQEDMLSGRTRTNKMVVFPGKGLFGKLVDIKVVESGPWTLKGILHEEQNHVR
jgi:tRNA-2-methylthio-N6-dimethylallyladenosine synthase